MKLLSTILAFLLFATGQPFAAAAGILCKAKKACPANAELALKCCCENGCGCDGAKEQTPAPKQSAGHENSRMDFVLVEAPMPAPGLSGAEIFKPFRIADELKAAHVPPRVAVTCIRLN